MGKYLYVVLSVDRSGQTGLSVKIVFSLVAATFFEN